MSNVTGRSAEVKEFMSYYESDKSEFVAVYGRRRVGKTYLINKIFKGKFLFEVTGISKATKLQQITNFYSSLLKSDMTFNKKQSTNWIDSFNQLAEIIEKSKRKRKVIFIDELPWFDTKRSGFMQALEYFWNSWASKRDDVFLITCGSATSWMINKLIGNKGGLHNRVTRRFHLSPFTLSECEEYLDQKRSKLSRYQIVQLYMVLGGIPFYWSHVDVKLSAIQNIQKLCFSENGILRTEFDLLFSSLFSNHDRHVKIILALAKKSKGLTREDIIKHTKLPNAGSTTKLLTELDESGFIRKYYPFGNKQNKGLYQLCDFYSLFYLKYIKSSNTRGKSDWVNMIDNPGYRAWSGYAYEQVCMYHIQQIKFALGISGVYTEVSSWRSNQPDGSCQVDLVMDRRDHIINLCEIKYSVDIYTISKKYSAELRNKIGTFQDETNTRKGVQLVMITTYGVKKNSYAYDCVSREVILDDLFMIIPDRFIGR